MYCDSCYYRKNNFKKGRETIVFLHGLTGHSGVWEKYFEHFKKKYNVMCIDLIGHGRSKRPFSFKRYSPSEIAKDVLKILEKEKISSAHFIVYSYSVLIFLELIKQKEKLVKSSVFIGPYYPNRKKFSWKIARIASFPLSALVYLFLTKKEYPVRDYAKDSNLGDFNVKRMVADITRTGFKSYVALGYYAVKYDILKVLKKIKVPILIIAGKHDPMVTLDDVKEISKQIKLSEVAILEEKAHRIVYLLSHRIIPLSEKFFKKHK
jgi:pimeloyl-ACP methyl ester carboxylesterase